MENPPVACGSDGLKIYQTDMSRSSGSDSGSNDGLRNLFFSGYDYYIPKWRYETSMEPRTAHPASSQSPGQMTLIVKRMGSLTPKKQTQMILIWNSG